ncbi:MAG: DUF503 domain-containing protein [Anaerolineae bacterium]|nr:DUF503 domain-containing protein [Anaerolineae bacterium]
MNRAIVGVCTLELQIEESNSLKDKRSVLKSLLARLSQVHHLAAAEIDLHDRPQEAIIAFAAVSNSSRQIDQMLRAAVRWIEQQYPQAEIMGEQLEIL